MKDRNTGQLQGRLSLECSIGYCFIEFYSSIEANQALRKFNGMLVEGTK